VDWLDIENIAGRSYDNQSYLQTEFLGLVTKAKKIYSIKKKKKKDDD
jgi:hypothetical protein